MRKTTLAIGVLLAVALVVGCAHTQEIEYAKLGAKVNYDTFTAMQEMAAHAYLNWVEANEQGKVPAQPYLTEPQWQQFVALSGKVEAAQSVYINTVKLAGSVEKQENIEAYLIAIEESREQVEDAIMAVVKFLDELGVVEGVL